MSIINRRIGGVFAGLIYVKKSKELEEDWWRKFVEIDKFVPEPKGIFPDSTPLDLFTYWDIGRPTCEDPICSHFGCGRILTLPESLASTKCIKHSSEGETIL